MRKTLLLSMCLFSVTRCQQPKLQLSGQEGGLIHISCPYDEGYETYTKYFYKGLYGHRKVLVKTTDNTCEQRTPKMKYDLCDDTKKRILKVTIYDLTLGDAGTYWCETDAYGFDPKMKIELQVHKAPAPVKPQPVTLNPPVSTTVEVTTVNQQQPAADTVSNTAVMCAAAMLFVCLFTLCLLLAVKHRRSAQRQNREASSDNEIIMPDVRSEPELLQESNAALGHGEYIYVDEPGNICHYEHLDLSQSEEHIYDSLQ